MKLLDSFISRFKKKEPIVPKIWCSSCNQNVPVASYNRKIKSHRIGLIVKDGKDLILYCDGKERK